MSLISVVIIAKNEAANIVDCIVSARQVSDDIIVSDSGSKDNTPGLVVATGARLLETEWKGYGQTRNEAATIAKNNWILSLDADERITPELAAAINSLSLSNEMLLYGFRRKSFLAAKKIRFGEWGRDRVYRLYHRQQASWDLLPVHENINGNNISKTIVPGELLHYTMKDLNEYSQKTLLYAKLSANKYIEQGRKASLIRQFISPVFSFIQNYICRLGFLDGKEGFIIAYTSSKYIYLKYKFLNSLLKANK